MTEKVHRIKIISKEPWCALVPSELLECDSWIISYPFQKTCKKGHLIEYYEAKDERGMENDGRNTET